MRSITNIFINCNSSMVCLQSSTGGRVSVFQTQLPTVGPGALKCREDPNERAGKVSNMVNISIQLLQRFFN